VGAVHVVDHLEVVEVDHDQRAREGLIHVAREPLIEMSDQGAGVRQVGQ
jgi:hypothetical protein